MRAPGAQYRRARGQLGARRLGKRGRLEGLHREAHAAGQRLERGENRLDALLAGVGEGAVELAVDGVVLSGLAAQKDELAFDDGIEFLDDEDLVNAFEEFRGELLGEGVGGGNLHDRKRKPRHVEGFHDVAVAHAAAGDAEGQLAAALFPGVDCLLVAGTAHLDAVVTVACLCQVPFNL